MTFTDLAIDEKESLDEIKNNFPHLKVLKLCSWTKGTENVFKVEVSIGLWGELDSFSTIAGDTNLRNAFVQSATKILESKGFHGLHVLWQWPDVADKTNYILLLEDLSKV